MRFGDPMAHLSRKKRHAESLNLPSVVDGLGLSMDDLKKSGFRIPQEVPPHSWLRRGVVAPHHVFVAFPIPHAVAVVGVVASHVAVHGVEHENALPPQGTAF